MLSQAEKVKARQRGSWSGLRGAVGSGGSGTKKPRRVRAGLRGLVMVTGCEPGIPGFCSECGGTLAAASRRGIPPAGLTPNVRIACAFTIVSRLSGLSSGSTGLSTGNRSTCPTRRTDGSLRRKILAPPGEVKPSARTPPPPGLPPQPSPPHTASSAGHAPARARSASGRRLLRSRVRIGSAGRDAGTPGR